MTIDGTKVKTLIEKETSESFSPAKYPSKSENPEPVNTARSVYKVHQKSTQLKELKPPVKGRIDSIFKPLKHKQEQASKI